MERGPQGMGLSPLQSVNSSTQNWGGETERQ